MMLKLKNSLAVKYSIPFILQPYYEIMLLIMYEYLFKITRDGMFGSIFCASEQQRHLSDDVASGSEITPCIKIDKPLVVYRFSRNLMK